MTFSLAIRGVMDPSRWDSPLGSDRTRQETIAYVVWLAILQTVILALFLPIPVVNDFDVEFLDWELKRAKLGKFTDHVAKITDTLGFAAAASNKARPSLRQADRCPSNR